MAWSFEPWTSKPALSTLSLLWARDAVDEQERTRRVGQLGRRIRQLRTERGISQEGLAALAGIDRGYMGHIERGSRNISVVKILEISDALSVEPAALFDVPGGGPDQALRSAPRRRR